MARRSGWTWSGTKRIPIRVGGVTLGRLNLNLAGIVRRVLGRDRPLRGRETRADQLGSITLGQPGRASWNSRSDRYTVDTPGPGHASRPANLRGRRRPQLDDDEGRA